jgi:elongation factor 1-gamma
MSGGKLYVSLLGLRYPAIPALVAAKCSGLEIKESKTDKEPVLLRAGASGLPAFVSDDIELVGTVAIAYYLAGDECRGTTADDKALVLQWIGLCVSKLEPAIAALVNPSLGLHQPNQKDQQKARDDVLALLGRLNTYLEDRTFLVGERGTLADVFLAAYLAPLFEYSIDAATRATFGNAIRWFLTVTAQSFWREVAGTPTLCEKAVPFDSKKFAERQKKAEAESKGKKEEKKEEKKSEKENKPKEAVAPKPKKEEKADEGDDDDDEPKEKERPDPFKNLPASTKFVMDEWKRTFSNKDKEKEALPWFWEHLDSECYSLWLCEYNYASDLKKIFMTSNLVNGMYQRLEKMMRNAFAVMSIFGVDGNNTIAGIWLWKGQDLAFKLDDDWQTDYESYTWKKLDLKDAATKKLVEDFWLSRENFEFAGRKFNSSKALK